MIIADVNEPASITTQITSVVKPLDIGDYLLVCNGGQVANLIYIERKTITDFLAVMTDKTDGRMSQFGQLVQRSSFPILLIEGVAKNKEGYVATYSYKSHVKYTAFVNALLSLQAMGLAIAISPSSSATPSVITGIYNWCSKASHPLVLKRAKPLRVIGDYAEPIAALMVVRGVGEIAATRLLKHFGTLERIANATEDELVSVKGINTTTAMRIKRLFTLKYNED